MSGRFFLNPDYVGERVARELFGQDAARPGTPPSVVVQPPADLVPKPRPAYIMGDDPWSDRYHDLVAEPIGNKAAREVMRDLGLYTHAAAERFGGSTSAELAADFLILELAKAGLHAQKTSSTGNAEAVVIDNRKGRDQRFIDQAIARAANLAEARVVTSKPVEIKISGRSIYPKESLFPTGRPKEGHLVLFTA